MDASKIRLSFCFPFIPFFIPDCRETLFYPLCNPICHRVQNVLLGLEMMINSALAQAIEAREISCMDVCSYPFSIKKPV